MVNSNAQLFPSQPPLFDYHSGAAHIEPFTSILEKVCVVACKLQQRSEFDFFNTIFKPELTTG